MARNEWHIRCIGLIRAPGLQVIGFPPAFEDLCGMARLSVAWVLDRFIHWVNGRLILCLEGACSRAICKE